MAIAEWGVLSSSVARLEQERDMAEQSIAPCTEVHVRIVQSVWQAMTGAQGGGGGGSAA